MRVLGCLCLCGAVTGCQLLSGGAELSTRGEVTTTVSSTSGGGAPGTGGSGGTGAAGGTAGEGGSGGAMLVCPEEPSEGLTISAHELQGDGAVVAGAIASGLQGEMFAFGNFDVAIDFGDGNVLAPTEFTDAFVLARDSEGLYLWHAVLTGSGNTQARAIAVDGAGDIYVLGVFTDTLTFTTPTHTSLDQDIFVAKLASDGQLQWVATTAIADTEVMLNASGIAIDSEGRAWVSGALTNGAVELPGGETLVNDGMDADAIVFALAPDGQSTFVATVTGDAGAQHGTRIAIGPDDTVYWAGFATGDLEIEGSGVLAANTTWIATVATTGDATLCQYVMATGGTSSPVDVLVTPQGDVVVAGVINGATALSVGTANYAVTEGDEFDAFVVRMSASCEPKWGRPVTGVGTQSLTALAGDGEAVVYAGHFDDQWKLGPIELYGEFTDPNLVFGRLASDGEHEWHHYFPNPGLFGSARISTDPCGFATVSTAFSGTFKPPGLRSFEAAQGAIGSAFVRVR